MIVAATQAWLVGYEYLNFHKMLIFGLVAVLVLLVIFRFLIGRL